MAFPSNLSNNERNPITSIPSLNESNLGRTNSNFPLYTEHRRQFINSYSESFKEKKSALLQFDNTDINFKKRKIKTGDNHNINITKYFKEKYEELVVDDEDNIPPKKIFTHNQLSDSEIEEYLKTAKFFWDFRQENLENELCSEFFDYFDDLTKGNDDKEFKKATKLKKDGLIQFIDFGKTMENHFQEMALKLLHITKYSTKKAIFILFKKLNPFLEEEIEGFKNDVNFLQREAIVLINEYDQEDK